MRLSSRQEINVTESEPQRFSEEPVVASRAMAAQLLVRLAARHPDIESPVPTDWTNVHRLAEAGIAAGIVLPDTGRRDVDA